MVALAQSGKVLVGVMMFLRWIVAKLDQAGRGASVTGRTGNATVITDKLF